MRNFHFVYLLVLFSVFQKSNANEQYIARVFDQTISQSDLTSEDGQELTLTMIIIPTLLEKYKTDNKLSFEPTPEEIQNFKVWFNKKLPNHKQDTEKREQESLARIRKSAQENGLPDDEIERLVSEYLDISASTPPLDERMANFMLPHWKSQIYFYQNYGGGRILWQQRGIEAFDAFHNWLKKQENIGNFEIFDKENRKAFYQYWNKESAFLVDDEESIKETFLNPVWSQ